MGFITKIEKYFNKSRPVFVVLENVEFIDYGAITVLLSIMIKFKTSGIAFNGNFPKNSYAKEKLIKSDFFKHLSTKSNVEDKERYEIGQNNKILTHAYKKTDGTLCDVMINNASKTIWGSEKKCKGVYRTLMELMQNTNNHAVIGKSGEKHWWLSINHNQSKNKVTFSFVDFGVGIFNSLNSRKHKYWYEEWFGFLKTKGYSSHAELLKLILDKKRHETVTGKAFRGKGLPSLKESLLRNQFSNLHVISNDVFADVSNEYYKTLSNQFSGTFVYFELISSNQKL